MINDDMIDAVEYYINTSDLLGKIKSKVSSDVLECIKSVGIFNWLKIFRHFSKSEDVKVILEILKEHTRANLGFCLSSITKTSTLGQIVCMIDFSNQFKKAVGAKAVCVDKADIDVNDTKKMIFFYDFWRPANKRKAEQLIKDLQNLVLFDLFSMTYALEFFDTYRGCIYVKNK